VSRGVYSPTAMAHSLYIGNFPSGAANGEKSVNNKVLLLGVTARSGKFVGEYLRIGA